MHIIIYMLLALDRYSHLSGPMARTFPRQKKKKSLSDRTTPLDQKSCKSKSWQCAFRIVWTFDSGNKWFRVKIIIQCMWYWARHIVVHVFFNIIQRICTCCTTTFQSCNVFFQCTVPTRWMTPTVWVPVDLPERPFPVLRQFLAEATAQQDSTTLN